MKKNKYNYEEVKFIALQFFFIGFAVGAFLTHLIRDLFL